MATAIVTARLQIVRDAIIIGIWKIAVASVAEAIGRINCINDAIAVSVNPVNTPIFFGVCIALAAFDHIINAIVVRIKAADVFNAIAIGVGVGGEGSAVVRVEGVG